MSPQTVETSPGVRVDHRSDSLGIGVARPRLTWLPTTGAQGYEIESARPGGTEAWSATVDATGYLGADWIGPDLGSREQRSVRVRGLLADGPGEWSTPVIAEAGLLERGDWSGGVAVAPLTDEGRPVLRRRFEVSESPRKARLYVTFLGIGVVTLNGRPVTDDVLAPGWQSYQHRIAVSTYDVTGLLERGENLLEVRLGDGWWAGRLGFNGLRSIYGSDVGVIAQLEWEGDDGVRQTVASDDRWLWAPGPTLTAELYDGETHDARREVSIDSDHVDPARWSPVVVRDLPEVALLPIAAPPIRRTQELAIERILTSPSGRTILDFGQNLVGWVRATARGEAGTAITLRFAEVLDEGEIGVRPLRSARATDRWILAGTGDETWEPSFTYHGFRYVEVDGWPDAEIDPTSVTAIVIESALPRAGWFSSAHQGLARLHENVVWSMRGNFVSIPTDCPQRDERLGWTGDIAMFAPTAGFLADDAAFLTSWLDDVAAEQRADGMVPYFVPSLPFPEELQSNPLFRHQHTAVWGDVVTLVPFALYQQTGDVDFLRRALPMMKRWVDGVTDLAGPGRVWDEGFQYGDWLDPAAPPDEPWRGLTETSLVATAYFAHSARITSEAARLTGRAADAAHYSDLHEEIVAAFRGRFVLDGGRLTSDSQTAYSIALQLRLLDAADRPGAGARLIELVRDAGHRVGTGFVGTPLVLGALTSVGAIDDAYQLLLQTGVPSWLYAVDMGATTIWERWDSMLPDGSINPGGMTSFNHYAFGAVADWLHSTVAGLSSLAPGWTRVRIAPRPHPAVGSASAAHDSPSGRVEVAWRLEGRTLELDVSIPDGVDAVLDIAGYEVESLPAGRHTLKRDYRTPVVDAIANAAGH
jgi:alpha-L-rhamnosidase